MIVSLVRRFHLHDGALEGLFLVVLGCLGIVERLSIGSDLKSRYHEPLSAGGFAYAVCFAFILGGIAWGIVSKKTPRQMESSPIISPTSLKALALISGYLVIMSLVGFYFSTVIFLFLLMRFCAHEKCPQALIFSVGLASSFYVLFVWLLNTSLP